MLTRGSTTTHPEPFAVVGISLLVSGIPMLVSLAGISIPTPSGGDNAQYKQNCYQFFDVEHGVKLSLLSNSTEEMAILGL